MSMEKIRFALATMLLLPAAVSAQERLDSVWVKVQGRWDAQGNLLVESLKEREPKGRFVFEGRVELVEGKIRLDGYEISPVAEAGYSFINGDPAVREDINPDTRIKAYGRFDGTRFIAEKISIFQYSKDDDIELEGILVFDEQDSGTGSYRIGSIQTVLPKGAPARANASSRSGVKLPWDLYTKFKTMNFSRALPDAQVEPEAQNYLYTLAQTTLISRLSADFRVYGRFEWRRKNRSGFVQPDFPAQESVLRVRSLHLIWRPVRGEKSLTIKAGRQRLRDKRSWLFDRYLDGVTLDARLRRLRVSLSATRGLTGRETNADQPHLFATALYHFSRKLTARFYYIKENDLRPGENDPSWYALQLTGKARRFDYWAQGAVYRTQDGTISRRGYGLDAGFRMKPLPAARALYLMYHFAYGSADDPATTDRREYFRQPNLQLNYYRYGGRRWLYYYGELLNPELSNLRFHGVTLGYRKPRFYVQLTGRFYAQNRASARLRGNRLGISPTGAATQLGSSLELSMSYYPVDAFELYLSAEWFRPGAAFATSETLSGVGLGLKYYMRFRNRR